MSFSMDTPNPIWATFILTFHATLDPHFYDFSKMPTPPPRHMNKGWGIHFKMQGVPLHGYRTTTRRQFTFYHKVPRENSGTIPGTVGILHQS